MNTLHLIGLIVPQLIMAVLVILLWRDLAKAKKERKRVQEELEELYSRMKPGRLSSIRENEMNMSNEARRSLESLIDEFHSDLFALTEEYYCHGICLECGHIQHGAEPDAEGYICEACDQPAVMGLEMAILTYL
jgi:rubrerythrin